MRTSKPLKGFFSYAHVDSDGGRGIDAFLVEEIEKRVTRKLANATFELWRDTKDLRAGDLFDNEIQYAISSTAIFFVLLTPSWISSDYCLREFSFFEGVERRRGLGPHIVPILWWDSASHGQFAYLNKRQERIYRSLLSRHYVAIDDDLLSWPAEKRGEALGSIVRATVGIVERFRTSPALLAPPSVNEPATPKRDLRREPHRFDKIDIVRDAEVSVATLPGGHSSSIWGQVSFVDRLYLDVGSTRVEFGLNRAFLNLTVDEGVELTPAIGLRASLGAPAYFLQSFEASRGLLICMDPVAAGVTLSNQCLPSTDGHNFMSKVAVANAPLEPSQVSATLQFSFGDVSIFGHDSAAQPPPQSPVLKSILATAARKYSFKGKSGAYERKIPITRFRDEDEIS